MHGVIKQIVRALQEKIPYCLSYDQSSTFVYSDEIGIVIEVEIDGVTTTRVISNATIEHAKFDYVDRETSALVKDLERFMYGDDNV